MHSLLRIISLSFAAFIFLGVAACSTGKRVSEANLSLKETMDNVVTRLYAEMTPKQLDTIGFSFVRDYLTAEEKAVLSKKYWDFEVNVPVTVSLMRDEQQKIIPFWIKESGFRKTGMKVVNESAVYEVWQKDFDRGLIELGINGFDRHRNVYFISVGARNPDDELKITPVFPETQHFEIMKTGAFTYHDWDELLLEVVPESLTGNTLFTTIRGRSREAHLVGAFRNTSYPSSAQPDQVLLTMSADPKTTMDVQWRSNTEIEKGSVRYWIKGSSDTLETSGEKMVMEDRLLQNDRYIHRFTAKLKNLQPGTAYGYKVAHEKGGVSEDFDFVTADKNPEAFSFFWTGDIHIGEEWGKMMQHARQRHPDTRFFLTSGDLVNTGLFRDQWDVLFEVPGDVFSRIPFMAAPGNHDSQEGLGAWMYQELFSYNEDSPTPETRELTYAFSYQNALFLIIDGTQPIESQTRWIEEKLSESKEEWKFVTFHFSPYNVVEDYDKIISEWIPLFDAYHVDVVFTGHWHYYMRSYPMKDSKVVKDPADGTIYLMSIGTYGKNSDKLIPQDYAFLQFDADLLYQHMQIDGHEFSYTSYNNKGEVVDRFKITK